MVNASSKLSPGIKYGLVIRISFVAVSYTHLDVYKRQAVIGAQNNYTVFYPSVNAAYSFYDHLNEKMPSWLSSGRLRASLDYVGNSGIAGPYSTGSGFVPATTYNQNGQSVGIATQFRANIKPNLDLKPQVQRSIELGTNLGFLNERLGVDCLLYTSRCV